MSIKGGDKFLSRLRKASRIEAIMADWAEAGATEVMEEEQRLIRDGASPPPNHIVSAPGNPPNEEYGDLARDMRVERLEGASAVAIAYSDHALHLEFGTSRMIERPFARPAAAILKKPLLIEARTRIDRLTKG